MRNEDQARKEISWKKRTGRTVNPEVEYQKPPQCAVEQFRHRAYGNLGGEHAGTVQ